MSTFIRIGCVIAGAELVTFGNELFNGAPIFRSKVLESARKIFLDGANRSERLGQKIDGKWLDDFILNDVMQPVTSWNNGGRDNFLLKAKKFENPILEVVSK